MHLSYKARYYSGKSSKPVVADVSMPGEGINITYTDHSGNFQSIHWEQAGITETDFSSSIVVLRYGAGFPYQQLEITDRDFIHAYKDHNKTGLVKRWLHFSSAGIMGLLVGGFLLSIVLGYFFVLPFVADHIARNFPVEYEISMGQRMYENILEDSKIDTIKTEAINHFFKQLHIKSDYPVKITVIRDSVVNAFAMPGGGIIVYDAILRKMDSPEELAALLSHEYSHVQLKHATRNIFRNVAGYLFISIIFSDANGIASIVVDNANQLRNLSYSRELEHEADENGLHILTQNHISLDGMADLFAQLKKEQHMNLNEFVSTHPDLDNRIDFVKQFKKEHPFAPQPHDSLSYYFEQLKVK